MERSLAFEACHPVRPSQLYLNDAVAKGVVTAGFLTNIHPPQDGNVGYHNAFIARLDSALNSPRPSNLTVAVQEAHGFPWI